MIALWHLYAVPEPADTGSADSVSPTPADGAGVVYGTEGGRLIIMGA